MSVLLNATLIAFFGLISLSFVCIIVHPLFILHIPTMWTKKAGFGLSMVAFHF